MASGAAAAPEGRIPAAASKPSRPEQSSSSKPKLHTQQPPPAAPPPPHPFSRFLGCLGGAAGQPELTQQLAQQEALMHALQSQVDKLGDQLTSQLTTQNEKVVTQNEKVLNLLSSGRQASQTSIASGSTDAIFQAFQAFDKDGDGKVSFEELKAVLCRPTTAGPGMAESEVEALFKTLDTNNSGFLDYSEMMKDQQMLETVFRI